MEIIANTLQVVPANQNVYFTDTVVRGGCSINHRSNSGLVTIKGVTNQCRARYRAIFSANIAIPDGETVGPIQMSLSLDGEPLSSSTMIVTPAAVEEFFNVFGISFIDVPQGCCLTISAKNTSDIPINVQNANLVIERVA